MTKTSKIKKKIMTSFRLHPADLKELANLSVMIGINKTEIIERALQRYFNDLSQGKPA